MSLENFADASARHFDDATQLITHQRYDNAAYLLGYVVECAMKTVFSAGPLMKPQKLGHDLNAISIDALQLLWIVAPAMRRYQIPESQDLEDFIRDWDPSLRYRQSGAVDELQAKKWAVSAGQVFENFVVQSVLDGWCQLS